MSDKSNKPHYIGVNAPFDLYEWLKETAEKENRSVSGQVVQLCQEARQLRENQQVQRDRHTGE